MKPDAYERNLTARAFDVARYLLFLGIPTNVGQVTSIRTLEKQIRRLKTCEYAELRSLGDEIAHACAAPPDLRLACRASAEAPVPPLWRVMPSRPAPRAAARALSCGPPRTSRARRPRRRRVDLFRPADVAADIAATLLYPVTDRPFREFYDWPAVGASASAPKSSTSPFNRRTRRDELLREFRGGLYAYDIVMDIGAYRDLHRHRRCQKFRQALHGNLGFDTPSLIAECRRSEIYTGRHADRLSPSCTACPGARRDYLLPFGARSRFLFKMDFAEAEYIARLRSGVKGHFSYRNIAWGMKLKMEELEPELGRLIHATPPWIEDPLTR